MALSDGGGGVAFYHFAEKRIRGDQKNSNWPPARVGIGAGVCYHRQNDLADIYLSGQTPRRVCVAGQSYRARKGGFARGTGRSRQYFSPLTGVWNNSSAKIV